MTEPGTSAPDGGVPLVRRAELRVWDDAACRRVHEATCEVLAETGVEARHPRALELLRQAGADVAATRARLPRELVERTLAGAPRRFTLKGRAPDGSLDRELADGETWFGTGPDCLYVDDPADGRRRARLADVERFARLAEQLPNIDFVMSMGLPEDADPERVDLAQLAAMLAGTRKPIVVSSPFGGDSLRTMVAMAGACGQAASLACLAMSSPPLQLDEICLDKLLVCGELDLPVVLAPAPSAGSTAPASIAAVVVVANAEVLAGLVVHQLATPGAPFLYGAGIGVLNMQTMVDAYRPPGVALGNQASIDLARWYGLPSWAYAGDSDSKLFDEQAAAEAAMGAILGELCRATLLHDVGYLESGLQSSYEHLVLGDELAAYARAFGRELPVDDEALALDEIKRSGPGGNHLARPMTRARYRDFRQSGLLDQSVYERWRADGATTLKQRIATRTADLLRGAPPFTLDATTRRRLDELVEQAPPGR
ncbi:MAG TPA: trimethylamine methyltransferase family protein [Thermoleophilia bacterium]|nr:trimethylamine methyltransferase family protein [Thermoleophilia bacterium]